MEKYQKTLKNGATKVNVWTLQNVLLFFMAANSNCVHFLLSVRFELGIGHCTLDAIAYLFKFDYRIWKFPKNFIAFSEQECENWIRGLRYMVNDTLSSPYPLEMERWLRKEFYHIENSRETYVVLTL